ncbi:protein RD3-like [Arapaima gigas]
MHILAHLHSALSSTMPLFGWRKRSREEAIPDGVLMRELLWHMEERQRCLARRQHPILQPIMSSYEQHQLELLCAQVQPAHTATVLARIREVLASNSLLPWELVYIFQQVLKDFLSREEEEEEEAGPAQSWTGRSPMKQAVATPTAKHYSELRREEIPTISSHVDRSVRLTRSYTSQREWDLPYYYPSYYQFPEAYSTAL